MQLALASAICTLFEEIALIFYTNCTRECILHSRVQLALASSFALVSAIALASAVELKSAVALASAIFALASAF